MAGGEGEYPGIVAFRGERGSYNLMISGYAKNAHPKIMRFLLRKVCKIMTG